MIEKFRVLFVFFCYPASRVCTKQWITILSVKYIWLVEQRNTAVVTFPSLLHSSLSPPSSTTTHLRWDWKGHSFPYNVQLSHLIMHIAPNQCVQDYSIEHHTDWAALATQESAALQLLPLWSLWQLTPHVDIVGWKMCYNPTAFSCGYNMQSKMTY